MRNVLPALDLHQLTGSPGHGYRVYRARDDRAPVDHQRWVGEIHQTTFDNAVIDNFFFGVAAVGAKGVESVVVFPGPGRQ